MAAVATRGPEESILNLLGGTHLLEKKEFSAGRVRTALRRGLPFSTIEALHKHAGLSLSELIAVIGIPERTLVRRKESNHLTPAESDRLYRVARCIAHAQSTLGDDQKAAVWLKRPNRALGNEIPLSLLDTDAGARQVEDVLLRIAHGILS